MTESVTRGRLAKLLAIALLLSARAAFGQAVVDTLALASGTAASNGAVALNLVLTSPAGNEPAAIQFAVTYPPSSVAQISASAAPNATAAGKTVFCVNGTGVYNCVVAGMNAAIITNGPLAVVNLVMAVGATSTPIGVTTALGSSPAGTGITITPTGGTVTGGALPSVTSLSCSPSTLGNLGISTCTVGLNGPAPAGGISISLGNSNLLLLTVPLSLTIGGGANSNTFLAVAGTIGSSSSATITASYNGTSASAIITLAATQYQLATSASPAAGGTVTPASGPYAAGTVVNLTATANSGYQFSSWTGPVANPNSASTTVTMSAAQTVTANFTALAGITIATSPIGLQFTVDGGAAQTAPQTVNLASGPHTIAVATTQNGAAGTQYVFSSWNDGGAASHVITVTGSASTYTASFTTQYQLTTAASPAAGGSVTPSTGTYYSAGTVVNLTATANSGYQFSNWTGPVANPNNASTTVTMSAAQTVTANFSSLAGITLATNPAGLQFTVDGGAAQTAPQTVNLASGPHTIAVATTQNGAAGTQYVFSSWNDGGAASHSITVTGSAATYTASFTTQYQLTTTASPAAGGTVTPASGGFYAAGTPVAVGATANSGYTFQSWTGGSVGNATSASTTVTLSAPTTLTANFQLTVSAGPSAFVQMKQCGAASVTSYTCSFVTPPTAGDTVIVGATFSYGAGNNPITFGTPTDNQPGDVYTTLVSSNGPYDASMIAGAVVVQSSGTFTVTASASAAGMPGTLNIVLAEYSNLTLTVDKAAAVNGVAASVTTTNAADVVLGVIGNCCAGNAFWSLVPGSGFNQRYPSAALGIYGIGFADAIVSTPGTYSYSIGCTPSYNCGSPNPYIDGGVLVVALKQQGTVSSNGVTIQTNPPGLQFSVDGGTAQTAPQTLNLSQGSHTIAVATTQAGVAGTQYLFSSWSDGGAASHTITVGGSAATYTASFQTQYQLTTSASPAAGGTVTPASGAYYNSGTVVNLTATANSGYQFSSWSGPVAAPNNASTTVTMSAAQTVAANFSALTGITIQTNPVGLQFSVDGGAAQTAPKTLSLSPGTHTIAVATTQAGGAGTQYVFSSWNDGGAASHSITVTGSAATYTASFTTQYQLTTSASPAAGGTVTPATGAFYNAGTVVNLTATANSGYQFSSWSGPVAAPNNASTTVTMSAAQTVTANFSALTGITIQTNPAGLQFSVDGGAAQTAPQTLSLSPGTHTIAVATTQAGGAGTQYVFSSWNDGGAASHSITVTGSAATYTASFTTQYQLTTSASPAAGGTVTPATGAFYNAGTMVNLTATANSGYQFSSWSGPVATPNNASTTVTMSAPQTVAANFSALTGITIQTNPVGLQFSVDGGAAQTAPQTLSLSPGTHTIAVATTQAGGAGTQYVFSSWNDGGAASHSITVTGSAATYTASFTTQYQLTTSASPAAGGTVTPATGAFYNAGTVVNLTATAYSGYQFSSWSGPVATPNSASTTVTMSAAQTVTANFSALTGITIQTNPAGLQFSVDGGAAQTAPQTVNLAAGPHTITVATTQSGSPGTQYVFNSWNDGGAASHVITVTGSAATYSASFNTQYQLTMAVSPAGSGSVTPASGGFYTSGAPVPITATANSGYAFQSWSGGSVANAGSASTTVTLSAPTTLTANFQAASSVTISSLVCNPSGVMSGVTSACTVTLSQSVSTATTVSLGSNSGLITVQPNVVVNAGNATAGFNANIGSISADTTGSVTATLGTSSQSATFTLWSTPVLSAASCSPTTISPSSSSACTVTMSKLAGTVVVNLSSGVGLTVPPTVTVPQGSISANFTANALASASGWIILTASFNGTSKMVVFTVGGSPFTSEGAQLSQIACTPKSLTARSKGTCRITLDHVDKSTTATVQLASSSASLRLPERVVTRPGQSSVEFRMDGVNSAEGVVVTASLGSNAVTDTVAVTPETSHSIDAPRRRAVRSGNEVRFGVSVSDPAASVFAHGLPAGASFDPSTGEFRWTPDGTQLGAHPITFSTVDSSGRKTSASVTVQVDSGDPVVTGIVNAATHSADAACSPGGIATIEGRWLTDGTSAADASGNSLQLAGVKVWANGLAVPILSASETELNILCPDAMPGSAVQMVVENGQGVADPVQTAARATAPGIFSLDGSGTGQGRILLQGTDLVAMVRNYQVAAQPAIAGETVVLYATGLGNLTDISIHVGEHEVTPQAVNAVPGHPGIYQVIVSMPDLELQKDDVQLSISGYGPEGTVNTNVVSIAVEPSFW